MGCMSHNAIIVTSYRSRLTWEAHRILDEVRDYAISLGCQVTECVESHTNGYVTFMIIPDGSKEGWRGSDEGDDRRAAFLEELKHRGDEWYFDWVEVQYGNDDGITKIVTHSDEDILYEGDYQ